MIETSAGYRFDDILTISRVFARSINIKRDFTPDADEKVSGYIPTQAAEDTLAAMGDATQAAATDRVRLVYGPYGGGKSNLGLVIARLLASGVSYPALSPVIERIAKGPRPTIAAQLVDRWAELSEDGSSEFLVILLNGNEGPFHDAMLSSLRKRLKEEHMEDLIPRTVYRAARDRIKSWREAHEDAYKKLEALLAGQGETIQGLDQRLKGLQQEAYELFCKLHPQIAAGAAFHSDQLSKVDDVYREVAKLVRKRSYAGLVVIWDEFGSYFEEACRLIGAQGTSGELKEIQDFVEMCHESRASQVHFLALAHRSLSEYAELAHLDAKRRDDWKRIEGRFRTHHLTSTGRERDAYEVLGRIIQHAPDSRWSEFLDSGARQHFQTLATEAMRLGFFDGWNLQDVLYVARNCYPLHPATVHILPRLSNAIAQNERTLFTYTSYDEDFSMRKFMETAGEFSAELPVFVAVDRLFDYFASPLRQERQAAYEDFTLAFYEAGASDIPEMDGRILQVMVIWAAVSDRGVKVLSRERCRFALGVRTEQEAVSFEESVDRLKDLGVIYERESDHALLMASRERGSFTKDFTAEVRSIEHSHDPMKFLRDEVQRGGGLLALPDIEPTAYHRAFKTKRIAHARFIGVNEELQARTFMADLTTTRDQVDGLVFFVVPQDDVELRRAKELATTVLAHDRVFVVVPPVPISVRDYTVQLDALKNLLGRQPYSNPNTGQGQMALDRRSSFRKKLENELRVLVRISSGGLRSDVYRRGEIEEGVNNDEELEDAVARLFETLYSRNLAIDDDQLSTRVTARAQATSSARTRRAVVDNVLRFSSLPKDTQENLNFGQTSAERRMVRALLVGQGYLHRRMTTWHLGKPKGEQSSPAKDVYDLIDTYFFEKDGQSRPVKSLLYRLSSPPYGLYSLPIPILIAVAIRDKSSQLQFFKSGKPVVDRETPLANVLVDMCLDPEQYSVVNQSLNPDQRAFLDVVMQAIGRKLSKSGADPMGEVAAAMRSWIQNDVPAYGRNTLRLGDTAKYFRSAALSVSTDPYGILVKQLPRDLGVEPDSLRDPSTRAELLQRLQVAAREVATSHTRINSQVAEVAAEVFQTARGSSTDTLAGLRTGFQASLDRADPVALESIRSQIRTFSNWMEREYPDADEAFGQLALDLVEKRHRSDWTDSDLDTVRTLLTAIKRFVEQLPAKPGPLTGGQEAFLRILLSVFDDEMDCEDLLNCVRSAGVEWYRGLSRYARRTTVLPQDARDFRDIMGELERHSARQTLLDILPQRLNLHGTIEELSSNSEAKDSVARRLRSLATRVSNAAVDIPQSVAVALRDAFRLTSDSPDKVLPELRERIEPKVTEVGEDALSKEARRFLAIIRRDDVDTTVLQAIGTAVVGKGDKDWDDGDVAFLRGEVTRLATLFTGLTVGGGTTGRKVRVAVSVAGRQAVSDIQYHEAIEGAAEALEKKLSQVLQASQARNDSQILAVAKVLQRLLERPKTK